VAVIGLCSASGSPGVTTTAVGLALSWSAPTVLVEADPTGGSAILAGYLRGQVGPPDALLELLAAHHQDRLAQVLPAVTLPLPGSSVSFLPGTRSHAQAGGLTGLWDGLLAGLKTLAGTGADTIVDLGRLGLAGSATPILYGADLTLVVCRADLVSLAGARSWVTTLRAEFEQFGAGSSLGLLLVGAGRPYTSSEVAKVLGVPVVATLDWDPKAAAVFSLGHQVRKHDRSHLVRDLRTAERRIRAVVERNRADLRDLPGPGGEVGR